MENRSFARPTAAALIDEGLRQHMLRVYNYMAGGLCITALVAFLIANTSLFNLFFTPTGMTGFGWLAMLSPLIMVFAFGWVITKGTAAQTQLAFWIFSALMGASLSPILMVYTQQSITRIFLITAATFGGMSLYGHTTKKDLTSLGSFMIMGVWGIIIAALINIFLKSSGLSYAISFLSVIIFTVLTAYDTQKIRQMYYADDIGEIASKKAVAGALSLYMDFINIFIALLNLLGERK